ncbi:MAG: hypothetical protein QXN62_02430 [Candidatus Bathyarchaeia archaeon]
MKLEIYPILLLTLVAQTPLFQIGYSLHPRIRLDEMTIYPPIETSFEDFGYYFDEYSDSQGLRPFPWGFEIWSGKPRIYCNSSTAHSGSSSVLMVGDSVDDMVVIAIPELVLKPKIIVGKTYRLEVWIRLDGVGGQGLRLMQQFFNSSETLLPRYRVFGEFVRGSTDWTMLTLDARIDDPKIVRGDPVIQFWGLGKVWIDDVKFYEAPMEQHTMQTPEPPKITIKPLTKVLAPGDSASGFIPFTLHGADSMIIQNISVSGEKSWIKINRNPTFRPSGGDIEFLVSVPADATSGRYEFKVRVDSKTNVGFDLTAEGDIVLLVVEGQRKFEAPTQDMSSRDILHPSIIGIASAIIAASICLVWRFRKKT